MSDMSEVMGSVLADGDTLVMSVPILMSRDEAMRHPDRRELLELMHARADVAVATLTLMLERAGWLTGSGNGS